MISNAIVNYHLVDLFPGWGGGREYLIDKIRGYSASDLLEIGSGANPTLRPEDLSELGVRYTTNDVDPSELAKAHPSFDTWQFNVSEGSIPSSMYGSFDLVFSRMVNEHVRDGEAYYRNIHELLKPNGTTIHCFSTLYAFPFVVNKLIPEFVSDPLLDFFAPRTDKNQHGKFKAYYSWARGPSKRMINRFQTLGFEVEQYTGYFGHRYYRKRSRMLDRIEQKKSEFLVSVGKTPLLTSYAVVILRKVD